MRPLALGLDMGFAHTGMVLAEVDTACPGGFRVLRAECVHTDAVKKAIGKLHLRDIYKADVDIARAGYLLREIRRFVGGDLPPPRLLAAESPTGGGRSAIAVKSMGIALGVLGALVELLPDTRFVNIQPFRVKQAVGGSLAAGKEGVARNVVAAFGDYAWTRVKKDREHILDAAAALLAGRDSDAYRDLAAARLNDGKEDGKV
jgi:Holliday junction resolvasome RuvABC endonuclease subunit